LHRGVHAAPAGLIYYPYRGSQYCSPVFQRMLKQLGMTASMSRRSNCYDNAPMESFWGRLKTELIHQRHYSTRPCAQQGITLNIELFDNRQRRYFKPGYLLPVAYAQQYYRIQQSARCNSWRLYLTTAFKSQAHGVFYLSAAALIGLIEPPLIGGRSPVYKHDWELSLLIFNRGAPRRRVCQ
jgi:transposase InsO family protein